MVVCCRLQKLRVRHVATRDCFVYLPRFIASKLLSEAAPLPLVVLLKEIPVDGNPAFISAHLTLCSPD